MGSTSTPSATLGSTVPRLHSVVRPISSGFMSRQARWRPTTAAPNGHSAGLPWSLPNAFASPDTALFPRHYGHDPGVTPPVLRALLLDWLRLFRGTVAARLGHGGRQQGQTRAGRSQHVCDSAGTGH